MSKNPEVTFTSERAKLRIARILAALEVSSMPRKELATKTFMSGSAASIYLTHLIAEPRQVYICGWMSSKGSNAPIYALGNQKHVPMIAKTDKQRRAKSRKENPQKHAEHLARQRVKYWEKRDAGKYVGIDRRVPSLASQIENFVMVNRHKTTGQIASGVDAKPSSVSAILRRMHIDGKVRPVQTNGNSRFKWESAIHALPALLTIPKQSPWSALGL